MSIIEAKLVEIMASRMPETLSEVSRDTPLLDIADSLDFIDIVGDIESGFRINLSNEVIAKVKTVGELIQAIEEALGVPS